MASNDVEHGDPWKELDLDDADLARLLDEPPAGQTASALRTNAEHDGFDNNAGETWIYPTNMPRRSYQLSIVQAALYRNTLVVLPTGLGKTFIAAVVMYNIYRWYPKGKVLFMAPTRPLVAQQIDACQRIMPFPSKDTVELTGKLQRPRRAELWRTKRVFFATPQVVQSDIVGSGDAADGAFEFPFKEIKLVVFDEAHKAKGRYAYTEVARTIMDRNRYFRVMALSATPGRTTEDVAEVVRNLFISHLEVRCDTSIDVVPYVHKRQMKTIVVPLGDDIKQLREELLQIIDPYMRQLIDAEVLSGSLSNMNRNFLLFEQKRFRDRSMHQRHQQQAAVNSNFSICISLYHALELLERHGLRVFLNNFEEDEEGRGKFVIALDRRLAALVDRLRQEVGPNPFEVSADAMTNGKIAVMPEDLDFGHPKYEHARSCLLAHFNDQPESRAIIFCEYRESVMLIYRLLLQHAPLLRPRCFVGQGGTTGSLRALTQKQQIQIMGDFRAGKSNILIATSIGEEGIDVGEVDLIVCFDISSSNPTRFVQRIGRTGRKRNGKVVMLVTEGREQQLLQDVLKNKDQTNKKLLHSSVVKGALYQYSPRLVPSEYNPTCLHTFLQPPEQEIAEVEDTKEDPKGGKKRANAKEKIKPEKGSQDLRKFFQKSTGVKVMDTQERHSLLGAESQPTQSPGVRTQRNIENSFKDFFTSVGKDTSLGEPTNESSRVERSVEEPEIHVDPKHLKRVNKVLKMGTPLVPHAGRNEDFLTQLRSSVLSKEGKLLLLRMRPDFLRESCENMKILMALGTEETAGISKEEQDIRDTYKLIESIFGSKVALDAFLEDIDFENYKQKFSRLEDDADNDDWDEMSGGQFMACVDEIFANRGDQGFCADNFDYIQAELKKTERYQMVMASAEHPTTHARESMVYDSLCDPADVGDANMSNYSITESKYSSQWDDFVRREPTNKSTPLQGPLVRAFKRQQLRNSLQGSALLERLYEDEEANRTDSMSSVPDHKDVAKLKDTCVPANNDKSLTSAGQVSARAKQKPSPSIRFSALGVHERTPSPAPPPLVSATKPSTAEKLLSELDFDMEAFLEPFPEEKLQSNQAQPEAQLCPNISSSQKENAASNNLLPPYIEQKRSSPDLFGVEESPMSAKPAVQSVKTNQKLTLAAKLAAKTVPPTLRTPPKLPLAEQSSRAPSATTKDERSPSIFDIYMRNTRRRGVLPTSPLTRSTIEPNDESMVVCVKRKASKRKILESSEDEAGAEQSGGQQSPIALDVETDAEEEIAVTQQRQRSVQRPLQQRKKRRLISSFIEQEAGVSGSEGSEDEADYTIGQYICDSVIVSSADEEEDSDASATDQQAMYLQSLKSPPHRRGAFKIPAPRVFNDLATVYSQAPPIEDSQYLVDSFVVHEPDTSREHEASLCPLERAEKILKERRRAKRQFAKVATINNRKRRRIGQLTDSSDEDADDFE